VDTGTSDVSYNSLESVVRVARAQDHNLRDRAVTRGTRGSERACQVIRRRWGGWYIQKKNPLTSVRYTYWSLYTLVGMNGLSIGAGVEVAEDRMVP